jgi:type I restriction enzyme S subunit
MAELCDIGDWRGGGTPSKLVDGYWNGNVPWVSPKDMKQDLIFDSADHITEQAVYESATKLVPADSILCVTRSGILAHTFPVSINMVPVTINQDIKALTPFEGIDSRYLAWALRAKGRQILETCSKDGTTVNSIESTRLYAYQVPLAPKREQLRVVAKIEELLSELDDGLNNLRVARRQLKTYRQVLLKHAFEGRLTADWRQEHSGKIDSAEKILSGIQTERAACYQKQLHDWQTAVEDWRGRGERDKKPTKPRKPVEPAKPSPEQMRKMWSPPPTWQWLQIGHFAFVTKLAGFEYTKFVQYDEDGDLPVIKAENAGPNGYRPTDYSRVHSAMVAELDRSYLEGGELLMVFVGAGTGNVAIVPKEQKFFLGPNVGMMRPESDKINARYVELFLRSPLGKDMALASVKSVAQPSLSMGTIRQIPIIVPTPPEQAEVVLRLEEKLSLIDRAEADTEEQLLKSESLRQAILKRAFSGKLVAQDPSDEPASILLKRIKGDFPEAGNDKQKMKRKAAA